MECFSAVIESLCSPGPGFSHSLVPTMCPCDCGAWINGKWCQVCVCGGVWMTNTKPSGMLMLPVNINHSTSPWLLPLLQCCTTAICLSLDHLILSLFKYFVKARTIGCYVLKVYNKIDPHINSVYDFSISSVASGIIRGRGYQTGIFFGGGGF